MHQECFKRKAACQWLAFIGDSTSRCVDAGQEQNPSVVQLSCVCQGLRWRLSGPLEQSAGALLQIEKSPRSCDGGLF
jgi:hypothetical protein